MHVAYSALRPTSENKPVTASIQHAKSKHIKKLRYKGYKAACHKYQQEIAAIQQYIPDWEPKFR
ncbi:hypothetical protein [Mucilaginibacter lacusdianchii]|uniref:hypothetical protein n=1 Tax=Mucilaginibacter lacusdianchii TaxID=2684211 RepID=UPI00131C7773|nr:hypothetical protein [Mucilaginibacter sp. JXJ CY 39]